MLKKVIFKYKKKEGDKVVDLKTCHEYLIDLYGTFQRFCDDYGVDCFLMWGSLLGAKREQGIIPWDDDIDLAITQDNFKKLVSNLPNLKLYGLSYYHYTNARGIYTNEIRIYKEGFYRVLEENFSDYLTPVCLDIFIAVKSSISDAKKIKKTEYKIMKTIELLHKKNARWKSKNNIKAILRIILRFFLKIIPSISLHKRIDKLADSFYVPGENYTYCFPEVLYHLTSLTRYEKDFFENLAPQQFETVIGKAPVKFDEILTSVYGDWKTPVDQNNGDILKEKFVIRK